MASEWEATSIGTLCNAGIAEIQTGPFGSQLHAHDYLPEGIPVVPTEAIWGRRIDHAKLIKISEAKAHSLARHRLQVDDILFARRGAQAAGHVGFVGEAESGFLCGTGAIRLRLKNSMGPVDPAFLSHVLADPASVTWFKFHAVGATMPNLNEAIIRSFPLRLPPLPEQRGIAHILGSLDDKIELNRRMNATLEEMARTLFQAWFVDFAPVRAKLGGQATGLPSEIADLFPAALVASEVGGIPEGWEVVALPDAIEVNPSRSLAGIKSAPYLDMASMPTRGHRPEQWIERAFGSGMKFNNGDTLVARITPCLENGKTAFVDFLEDGQVGWGSTEYIVLRPKEPLPPPFAYYLARTEGFRAFAIQNMTGSSGRQRVPAECLKQFPIVMPTAQLAQRFGELARGFMERIRVNSEQIKTLAALRDALLPKLIAGELHVTSDFGASL